MSVLPPAYSPPANDFAAFTASAAPRCNSPRNGVTSVS